MSLITKLSIYRRKGEGERGRKVEGMKRESEEGRKGERNGRAEKRDGEELVHAISIEQRRKVYNRGDPQATSDAAD